MLASATQQAALLQQALPLMLPVRPDVLRARLGGALDGSEAGPEFDGLTSAGLPEQQAL
ncbi:hypothetical protein MNEG_15285, partial [Monoraphidium neglectum]